MIYETIFARSFGRLEKKYVGFGAFMRCFIVAFFVCAVLKLYNIGPRSDIVSFEQSSMPPAKTLTRATEVSEPQQSYVNEDMSVEPILQNFTNSRTQVYEMKGDIRINGNSSTIFISSNQEHPTSSNWTTRPYARNDNKPAMEKVRKFTIIHHTPKTLLPRCTRNFTSPAILFSTGGYAGNLYHDFSDVLIPLYSTAQQFNKKVIFLISDMHSQWTLKYKLILENLSEHEIIDTDSEKGVLCFPYMIVGLKANKELTVDPLEYSPHVSTTNFTNFLRRTYSSDRELINKDCIRRPRLLIISRKKTRHLTNEDEVANVAQSLGFEVVVREMGWDVSKVSKFVNSFDVMIGVHGAGVTNMVFLPKNAVVIQIVPFGLNNVATCYQESSKRMNLRYLEYNVSLNESSLFGRFPLDSEIYRNPIAFQMKGWNEFRKIYLDSQDVNVDLSRFRKTLLKALELVCS